MNLAKLLIILSIFLFSSPIFAETWLAGSMKDAGDYPRLVIMKSEIDQAKIRANHKDYQPMMLDIQKWADREYDLTNPDKVNEEHKGLVAKANAFLFLLGIRYDLTNNKTVDLDATEKKAMGDKALKYLLAMQTESKAKGLQPNGGIHTAEELTLYSQCYDCLKGGNYDFGGKEKEAVQNIADLAADIYGDYEINNWFTLRSYVNNHRAKASTGLGATAIALNGADFEKKKDDGRYEIFNWVDFAMRNTDFSFMDILTDWEGAFQESYSYYVYTVRNVYPFMWAWNRYTGAASWDIDPLISTEPPYHLFDQKETYTIKDFWTSDRLNNQIDWLWKTMQPDFTLPSFDDCTPGSRFPFGFFINKQTANHPHMYRWFWEQRPEGINLGGLLASCEMLTAFDNSIEPIPATDRVETDYALPVSGNVVFRTSWEKDAVYLLAMAEHGKAAANSRNRWGDYIDGTGGHEHADPGQFTMFAYGEPLIIDAGYLGWSDHEKVNNPDNHNIILIDKKGPTATKAVIPEFTFDDEGNMIITSPEVEGGYIFGGDGEAWLIRHKTKTNPNHKLRFAEIVTEYHENSPDVEITRRILMLDDRAAVIYDEIQPLDNETHELTFQLHGHGGDKLDSGSFEKTEFGGRWTRENASLSAYFASDKKLTLETRESIHDSIDVFAWKEETHTAMDAKITVTNGEMGRFLAVLIPQRITLRGIEEVAVTPLKSQDELVGFEWQEATSDKNWKAVIGTDKELTLEDQTKIKAAFASWYQKDKSSPEALYTIDMSYLKNGDSTWIDAGNDIVSLWCDTEETDQYSCEFMSYSDANTCSQTMINLNGLEKTVGTIASSKDASGITVTNTPDTEFSLVKDSNPMKALIPVRIQILGEEENKPNIDSPLTTDVFKETTLYNLANVCDKSGNFSAHKHTWLLVQKPELSKATLTADNESMTAITPDLPGEYIVRLNAETTGKTGTDVRTITAIGEPRVNRPVIDGDEDIELEEEEEVAEVDETTETSEVLEKEESSEKPPVIIEDDNGGGGCNQLQESDQNLAMNLFMLLIFAILFALRKNFTGKRHFQLIER